MERLDLEHPPPHRGAQVRLGHVLQHEFGRQRAAERAGGGIAAVRRLEAVEPLQGGGRGGVPGGDRRVELADAVPLLGDEADVHRPPAARPDRLEDAVVAGRVGARDPLAVQAAHARADAHADQRDGGDVDLGVAVGVGVVRVEVEVALVGEPAVEHDGRGAVGALDRAAGERGVVVGDEGVALERDIVDACAGGARQHRVRHGEAVPVAG